MGEKCKLTFLSQTEIIERAERKIIDMVDEAYRKGNTVTQPDVEKMLSAPPYKFSHGFICKKLKQLQCEKKIRCWQEGGVNHFDVPPLIPEPIKLAILVTAIVIGVSTMIDVVSFGLTGQQYTFMIGSTGESVAAQFPVFQLSAIKCGIFISVGTFIVTFLQYFFGMFKDSKTKKYLKNGA